MFVKCLNTNAKRGAVFLGDEPAAIKAGLVIEVGLIDLHRRTKVQILSSIVF